MADYVATQKPKQTSLHLVVRHADGSRDDLGVVSYWSARPARRLLWALVRDRDLWARWPAFRRRLRVLRESRPVRRFLNI